MNRKDRRRSELIAVLNSRHQPIRVTELRTRLRDANDGKTPSRSCVYSDLRELANMDVPLHIARGSVHLTEKPVVLFDELSMGPYDVAALLAAQKVLSAHGGRWFSHRLAGLERQLKRRLGPDAAVLEQNRVRVLKTQTRHLDDTVLGMVVDALLNRYRLALRYTPRSKTTASDRLVSPQRLVMYRGNWFLDVVDHASDEIRTLAVERISDPQAMREQHASERPGSVLDAALASGYGIFSGKQTRVARIWFSEFALRWTAEQHWHHEARWHHNEDGSAVLSLPYSRPEELLRDIMTWGAEAEIVAPVSLRQAMIRKLEQTVARYQDPTPPSSPRK